MLEKQLIETLNEETAKELILLRQKYPNRVDKARQSLNEVRFGTEEEIEIEIDNQLSKTYIRTYRTIIDDLYQGGLIQEDRVNLTYLRRKITSPGELDNSLQTQILLEGQMYMYKYDPIYKNKLEYYDPLPLVTVLSLEKDGFIGLNWHMMEPEMRIMLLEVFEKFTRGRELLTHLAVTWDIIKSSKRFRIGVPMVRRYNTKGVTGKFMKIPVDDWRPMMAIESPRFVGTKKEIVHLRNRAKIRNS